MVEDWISLGLVIEFFVNIATSDQPCDSFDIILTIYFLTYAYVSWKAVDEFAIVSTAINLSQLPR